MKKSRNRRRLMNKRDKKRRRRGMKWRQVEVERGVEEVRKVEGKWRKDGWSDLNPLLFWEVMLA